MGPGEGGRGGRGGAARRAQATTRHAGRIPIAPDRAPLAGAGVAAHIAARPPRLPRSPHRPVPTLTLRRPVRARAGRRARPLLPLLLAAALAGCRSAPGLAGGTATAPASAAAPDAPPAMDAIVEADLRRDLFALAADSMRGREAGTLDELRAAAWVAERAREAGLRPAGDDGTWFQWWPMRRVRPDARSRVALDGAALTVGRDVAVVAPVDSALDLPLVWIGAAGVDSIARLPLRGRAVAARLLPPASPPVGWISLRGWRYARQALAERTAALAAAGAAAVLLVADDSTAAAWPMLAVQMQRGSYAVDSAPPPDSARLGGRLPVLWAPAALAGRVAGARRLAFDLRAERFVYPSANVVAVAPGRDPALRGEYVLFSGHHDHDGVRVPRGREGADSIWRGADDNASIGVAMLAIGRAFVRAPGRRSALFVWHGAEERGLLGSRWYAAHPTVPRGAIVAVLNADMIGRNAPDSAALLGVQPPHRNSRELAEIALAANARTARFALDSTWDRPTHPEGWYFRSDHLPYARAGIPALMFTTLLHADYHTPDDRPERIDYAKLARMTRWMYATGWALAARDGRPAVDPGFRLER